MKRKPTLGKLKKELTKEQKLKLMIVTTNKLGLPTPKERIFKNLKTRTPMPIIIHNEKLLLWLDREYIAFSEISESKIRYVFATKEHYDEEIKNYRGLSKLPSNIANAFKTIYKFMEKYQKNYYISKNFFYSEFEDAKEVFW